MKTLLEKINQKEILRHVDHTLLGVTATWEEIQEIVAGIPAPEEIAEKLTALGAKTTLTDIGVPEEKLPEILDAAPYCRNRLTLMRLRRMIRG